MNAAFKKLDADAAEKFINKPNQISYKDDPASFVRENLAVDGD